MAAREELIHHYIATYQLECIKEVFKDEDFVTMYATTNRNVLFTVNSALADFLLIYEPIRRLCLESRDVNNNTPLMAAITMRNWYLAKVLITHKCNVDAYIAKDDGIVITPLTLLLHEIRITSSLNTLREEVMILLLSSGADPNPGNLTNGYFTPLHLAMHRCDARTVELLFQYGCKLFKADWDDWSGGIMGQPNILRIALGTSIDRIQKFRLLFAYCDVHQLIDKSFLASVLNRCNYEIVEMVLAYVKIVGFDIDKFLEIVEITIDTILLSQKVVALLLITFPGWQYKTITLKLRRGFCTIIGHTKYQVIEYVNKRRHFPIAKLMEEGLPTLFDMVSTELRYAQIRQEIELVKIIESNFNKHRILYYARRAF